MKRPSLRWIAYGLQTASLAAAGCLGLPGWRPLGIPDRFPIGAVERAHFHTMQTNGEAGDFIMYQMDFVGDTAELNVDGRRRISSGSCVSSSSWSESESGSAVVAARVNGHPMLVTCRSPYNSGALRLISKENRSYYCYFDL